MRYLTGEEILVIHARLIDETGGLHGIRDMNLLSSLMERPKMSFGGKELYLDIFAKATVYFTACAYHHIFMDGNKRTAVSIAIRFLFQNGWEFVASNKELENFAVKAVENKFTIDVVAEWFKKYSQKIKKK